MLPREKQKLEKKTDVKLNLGGSDEDILKRLKKSKKSSKKIGDIDIS